MTPTLRAQLLLDEIRADPILQDFARRTLDMDARGMAPMPLATPEDVLGEQGMIAGSLCMSALEGHQPPSPLDVDGKGGDMGGEAARILSLTAGLLYRATPYLWLADMLEVASSLDVPRHVFTPESLPTPLMWWTHEHDGDIPGLSGLLATGTLWVSHPGGMVEVILIGRTRGDDAHGYQLLSTQGFRKGFRYPDDVPAADTSGAYRQSLAMLSFLNSPYIPKKQMRIDRRLRRALGRGVKDTARLDQTVHFIDLRAPEAGLQVKSEPTGEGVEYRHRWLVRGHHRAQYYPSLDAHKVIWIAPYVKGPEGAPMLTSAYRVRR